MSINYILYINSTENIPKTYSTAHVTSVLSNWCQVVALLSCLRGTQAGGPSGHIEASSSLLGDCQCHGTWYQHRGDLWDWKSTKFSGFGWFMVCWNILESDVWCVVLLPWMAGFILVSSFQVQKMSSARWWKSKWSGSRTSRGSSEFPKSPACMLSWFGSHLAPKGVGCSMV